MTPAFRDQLGLIVREAWIEWAKTTMNPNPTWLIPYDELPEDEREMNRHIGEAVFCAINRWGTT